MLMPFHWPNKRLIYQLVANKSLQSEKKTGHASAGPSNRDEAYIGTSIVFVLIVDY